MITRKLNSCQDTHRRLEKQDMVCIKKQHLKLKHRYRGRQFFFVVIFMAQRQQYQGSEKDQMHFKDHFSLHILSCYKRGTCEWLSGLYICLQS